MKLSDQKQPKSGPPSTLPFDPADLTKMRVNQAGLARMMGVSRQTVSEWVKSGKISIFPDGTIDPQRAYQEYLLNSDPSRMRNKMLQPLAGELETLKVINADLAGKLEATHGALQSALSLLAEQSAWLEQFAGLVDALGEDLCIAVPETQEQFSELVQRAFDEAGERAMTADPADALSRLDEHMAAWFQP